MKEVYYGLPDLLTKVIQASSANQLLSHRVLYFKLCSLSMVFVGLLSVSALNMLLRSWRRSCAASRHAMREATESSSGRSSISLKWDM